MSEEYLNHLKLKREVIKILAFFDMFDYPLTLYEIWQELGRSVSLGELWNVVANEDNLDDSLTIVQQRGFYFLTGREEIVAVRSCRYNYAQRKLKSARFFGRIFSWCPWVKMVALANSMGAHNLRDGSDIDFFIITAPRRIWLSRLYCAGLAQLFKRRPGLNSKRDKLCLSFYLSLDHLNIDSLRLDGADPYFDRWRQQLVLLYNKNRSYEKFLQANNLLFGNDFVLIEKVNHEVSALQITSKNIVAKFSLAILKSISLTISKFFNGEFLEDLAKAWQLKIMPAELKAAAGASDGVLINNQILKFYLRDRRRSFAKKYEQKIRTFV